MKKSNFRFKVKSSISILQFKNVNFQVKQICHFPEIYVEFSLASMGCNYELKWNNFY